MIDGRRRGSASSPAARPISTCARRCTTSASTTRRRRSSAFACTRSTWSGRSRRKARATSPRACRRCSSSRRSAVIEEQLKEELYNCRACEPPARDRQARRERARRLPAKASHARPWWLARSSRGCAGAATESPLLEQRIARLDAFDQRARPASADHDRAHALLLLRLPAQHLDEGARGQSRAWRHRLPLHVDVMNRNATTTITHMGGEGANWIGQAPFTTTPHVFQNLGDGTYYPFRLARDPRRDRRGRQHHLQDPVQRRGRDDRWTAVTTAPSRRCQIAQQVAAEGVQEIVVVTDDPKKYPANAAFPLGTTIEPPHRLDGVQKRLREVKGVSILIYDQTCATEKRRRRKQGDMVDPARRVFINDRASARAAATARRRPTASLCCRSRRSTGGNVRSISPLATRTIHASEGFCPSFVKVMRC